MIGVVASSLDYAGVLSLYVPDRATGRETAKDALAPPARRTVLPDRAAGPRCRTALPERSGAGPVSARANGLSIDIGQRPGGSTLRAVAPGVEVDLEIPLPDGHESLGVVVPWTPGGSSTRSRTSDATYAAGCGSAGTSTRSATGTRSPCSTTGATGWAEEARQRW